MFLHHEFYFWGVNQSVEESKLKLHCLGRFCAESVGEKYHNIPYFILDKEGLKM